MDVQPAVNQHEETVIFHARLDKHFAIDKVAKLAVANQIGALLGRQSAEQMQAACGFSLKWVE
jgi:hypothetical protein